MSNRGSPHHEPLFREARGEKEPAWRWARLAEWLLTAALAGALAMAALEGKRLGNLADSVLTYARALPDFRKMQLQCDCEPACHCCGCAKR